MGCVRQTSGKGNAPKCGLHKWAMTPLAVPLPGGRMTNVIILKGPVTCSVIPNKHTQHYGKTDTSAAGCQPGKKKSNHQDATNQIVKDQIKSFMNSPSAI